MARLKDKQEEAPLPLTLDERIAYIGQAVAMRFRFLEEQILNLSKVLAEKEHGEDIVAKATEWAQDAGTLGGFILRHHPYDALVKAYWESGR